MAINPGSTGVNAPAPITPPAPSIQTNEYEALTTSAGNWTIGDILTRLWSIPSTGIIATSWYKPDGVLLSTLPVVGVDVRDLDQQTLAAIKAGGSSALQAVTYRTVGGTVPTVGYLSQLSTGQTLYTGLDRATTVTIGAAAGNAIASTFAPVTPFLISNQSMPAPFVSAVLNSFTQPAVGASVTVTVSALETAVGTEAQYTIGSEVFLSDALGAVVGGRYIVRGTTYPTLSIELQDPTLNGLGIGQTAIASGAVVPSMRMASIGKLTPPVGATHSYLSIIQSTRAIASATRYANSSDPTLRLQSLQDRIQLDRTVAVAVKPSSLHVDRGPKRIIKGDTTTKLGPETVWLHGLSDIDAVQCSIDWMGGW
jgi:hypothetical protein